MSLLRVAIGAVLRRLRHRQGRTLQDVADAAGVSLPYLSEIERGRKEASSEVLAGICRALGIGLPDLLDEVRHELLRTAPSRRLTMRSDPGRSPGSLPARGHPAGTIRTAGAFSAGSRSAGSREKRSSGFRTPRLAVCRTLSPMASSSPTNS
ncbi:helix-turn-helix transcriptional regulator [Actinoplanes sp. N902-109]|uniref:helix-turn-helix domain-containing protein n=1 Tax=Actinoplanes sp. (strain N902-109) TaxID=649831 RepID=UPI0003A93218